MGRRQEFETDAILERAMWVMWRQGYRATSMADIEQATGLNPGSLYNAFGSKKGLFLKVVDHYVRDVVDHRIETVLNTGSPLDGIGAFFRSAFEEVPDDWPIGCLLTNTATENGADDADIQARVTSGMDRIEIALRSRLEQARSQGSVSAALQPVVSAAHLISCYQGLLVIGRLTGDRSRLATITDGILASLRA